MPVVGLKIEHATTNVQLKPGQHVTVSNNKIAYPSASEVSDGVVNPFKTHPVEPGEVFAVFFKPESNAFFLE